MPDYVEFISRLAGIVIFAVFFPLLFVPWLVLLTFLVVDGSHTLKEWTVFALDVYAGCVLWAMVQGLIESVVNSAQTWPKGLGVMLFAGGLFLVTRLVVAQGIGSEKAGFWNWFGAIAKSW